MGPVNWLGVVAAALAAVLVGGLWYGPLFSRAKIDRVGEGVRAARASPLRAMGTTLLLALVSAAMLGHLFARVTPGKPWVYLMMSGGIALGFNIPALWTSYTHQSIARRRALIDAGYWLAAYLAMGAVFLALS